MLNAQSKKVKSIKINILGGVHVFCDVRGEIPIHGTLVRTLLCILACSKGGLAQREKVISMLWADESNIDQAQLKLRQLLYRLKRQLNGLGEVVGSGKTSIWLDLNICQIDMLEFKELIDVWNDDACERAISLYHGPIFGDEEFPTAEVDSWVGKHNEKLLTDLSLAARHLLKKYLTEELLEAARRVAARLADKNILDRNLQHCLIEVFIACEEPDTAIQQYERHKQALRSSLGERPSEATEELIKLLRTAPNIHFTGGAALPTSQGKYFEQEELEQVRGNPLGQRTVSYMNIQFKLAVLRGDHASASGEQLYFDRLEKLVIARVLSLEGEILRQDSNGMEISFSSPSETETTALRSSYAATRIIMDLEHQTQTIGTSTTYNITAKIALSTKVGRSQFTDSNDAGTALERACKKSRELVNLAGTNEIVLCATTHQAIRAIFKCKRIDGADESPAYFLRGRFPAPRHFDIRVKKGLTSLIGRDSEFEFLKKKWDDAQQGDNQTLVLRGELGAGKSRLAYELERYVTQKGNPVLHLDCNYIFRETAYYPIKTLLERIFSLEAAWLPEKRFAKVSKFMAQHGQDVTAFGATLKTLLGLHEYSELGEYERVQDDRTLFTQIDKIFRFISGENQALVVVEDIEWIDSHTARYIDFNRSLLSNNGQLLLLTIGASNRLPTPLNNANLQIELGPLSGMQCDKLFATLDPDHQLQLAQRSAIRKAAGGIPLHFEELVKGELAYVQADGNSTRNVPEIIKSSVQGYLEVEDHLSSLLHCAAVLKSPFSSKLMQFLCDAPLKEIERSLMTFVDANILTFDLEGKSKLFTFRHNLLTQIFLDSIPAKALEQINYRLASILSEHNGKRFAYPPEVVAQFWTAAGMPDKSAPFYLLAAREANHRSAFREAEELLSRAVRNLDRSKNPDTNIKLELLVELASTISRQYGVGSERARVAWNDAHDNSLNSTDHMLKFRISWGLWSIAMGQAKLPRASALSSQILRESGRIKQRDIKLEAHHCNWTTFHLTGRLEEAERHINQGLELYSMIKHSELAEVFGGHDPGVCCRTIGGIVNQLLGNEAKASLLAQQGLDLAIKLSHSGSIAHALLGFLDVSLMQNNAIEIKKYGTMLLELSENEHYFDFHEIANIFLSWARVRHENDPEGVLLIKEAIRKRRTSGSHGLPLHAWMLCDAEYHLKLYDDALKTLDFAQEAVNRTGETWWRPALIHIDAKLSQAIAPDDHDNFRHLIEQGKAISKRQPSQYFMQKFENLAHDCLD